MTPGVPVADPDANDADQIVRVALLRVLARGFGRSAAGEAVQAEARPYGVADAKALEALERLEQQGIAVRGRRGWRLHDYPAPWVDRDAFDLHP